MTVAHHNKNCKRYTRGTVSRSKLRNNLMIPPLMFSCPREIFGALVFVKYFSQLNTVRETNGRKIIAEFNCFFLSIKYNNNNYMTIILKRIYFQYNNFCIIYCGYENFDANMQVCKEKSNFFPSFLLYIIYYISGVNCVGAFNMLLVTYCASRRRCV